MVVWNCQNCSKIVHYRIKITLLLCRWKISVDSLLIQRIPFSKPVQAAQRRKNIFVEFDTYKKNWKVISKRIPHWKTKKQKKNTKKQNVLKFMMSSRHKLYLAIRNSCKILTQPLLKNTFMTLSCIINAKLHNK